MDQDQTKSEHPVGTRVFYLGLSDSFPKRRGTIICWSAGGSYFQVKWDDQPKTEPLGTYHFWTLKGGKRGKTGIRRRGKIYKLSLLELLSEV